MTDSRRDDANSRLLAAARAGDVAAIRAALADGANVHTFGIDIEPPYVEAAKQGHALACSYLLDCAAKTPKEAHALRLDAETWALQEAARHGRYAVIQMIIERGARLDVIDNAAFEVAKDGHEEALDFLIERGADPRACRDGLLIHAAQEGDSLAARRLLEEGANPRVGNNAALQAALEGGFREIAALLVERGANASYFRHNLSREAVRLLETVEILASPDSVPQARQEGLLICAAEDNDLPAARQLLDDGANPRALGNLALRHAVERGSREMAQLLLERGAQPWQFRHRLSQKGANFLRSVLGESVG
jgi:ankyrin repeat protein